jgi:hypothetical protein
MTNAEAFQAFRAIVAMRAQYEFPLPGAADTRIRLIDKILREVLGWPNENITQTEDQVKGYLEYVLHTSKRAAVVEVRRSSEGFQLPADAYLPPSLTLGTVLRVANTLQPDIDHVSEYCWRNGIEYAVITNGQQWLIFKALRTDGIHIAQNRVLLYRSLADIEARFNDFWSQLAKSQMEDGSLNRGYPASDASIFQYKRIVDELRSRQDRVSRNTLSRQVEPLIGEYMGEIAGEDSSDKLRDLFVKSRALEQVLRAVEQKISFSLSSTVRNAARLQHGRSAPGLEAGMTSRIKKHLSLPPRGEVVLLLGRVGSGKTTFVNHFLKFDLKHELDKHVVALFDFRLLESGTSVHSFFYSNLQQVLAKSKVFSSLTSAQLRKVYAPEIRMLSTGPLAVLQTKNQPKYEEKIAEFLLEKYSDLPNHLGRSLRYLADREGIRAVLFFDNVDQLDFTLQQEVFKFAHSVTGNCHAFSILPMWEETFLRSTRSGALATYQTPAYTLPPTSVVDIINRRLEYISADVRRGGLSRSLLPDDEAAGDVAEFLSLVRNSILNDSKRARFFLEALSMGNLRKAMKMFEAFLLSGHTDAGKMLSIVRTQSLYLIPLHEFVKSIGLGDQRYYQGSVSYILNLYAISDESRPSHFTKLRLLNYLFFHRNRTTSFGVGFVQTEILKREFLRIGVSESDFTESLKNLAASSLVENDVYDSEAVSQAYRITVAGRYYSRHLAGKFAYLDLVLHDTPIADGSVFSVLKSLVSSAEMEDRFQRVLTFLNYLKSEEEREYSALLFATDSMPLRDRIVLGMIREFEEDRAYIRKRVAARRNAPSAATKTPYTPTP